MSLTKAVGFCVSIAACPVWALPSDAEQPVYIDSNTATYDEKAQTSTYTGNVVATQGSLKIESNQLVAHLKDGSIVKLVATGSPARFKQLPAQGKDEIHGEGLTGEFYPDESRLVLIKNAIVSQGDFRQASDLISYDTKNSLLTAGEKTSDAKRVHSVIKPKPKNAK